MPVTCGSAPHMPGTCGRDFNPQHYGTAEHPAERRHETNSVSRSKPYRTNE